MRKIYIDGDLLAAAGKFSKTLFQNRSFTLPKKNLEDLKNKLKLVKEQNYRAYIQKIIDEYERILSATPSEMKLLINEFDALKVDVTKKTPYKKFEFHKSIVHAMRYEDLRKVESIPYLKNSGLKTCVYCNAQLSVVVENIYYDRKKKKKIKTRLARLELDHYYSKSKYPFLCTSFFNLYPVCSNCNKAKGDKPAAFTLYSELDHENKNVFNFWLNDESITKYKVSRMCNDFKIHFDSIDGNVHLRNNHNDIFCIEGIYNTQKDLAEEILIKSEIYSKAYKRSLINSFGTVIYDEELINRLLLGNYDKPEDIHKRPMAKFTQDIAKQLHLI